MRIIITVYTYYPLKDGVQSVTAYHAEGLVKLGHDVTVVTPMHVDVPREEWHNGVRIIRVDVKTVHAIHTGDISGYRELILRLTEDADVMLNVCTQNVMTDTLFPLLAKIKCRKVLYMHGMHDFSWRIAMRYGNLSTAAHKVWNDLRWGWLYARAGKFFKEYDDIIQLHRFDTAYQFFEKKYGLKCKVLENAAEPQFFAAAQPDEIENLSKNYVVCVANYIPRKNQKMLVEAYYMSNLSQSAELILIGSEKTAYYRELCELSSRLYKNDTTRKVHFLHSVPRSQTQQYVKNARVYLLGSTWEAFPISIVEAMASGVPFISTDVGCVRFFPGGVLVRNKDEMAYWLETLMSDERLRSSLGKMGAEYARKHMTVEAKVLELEKILKGTHNE